MGDILGLAQESGGSPLSPRIPVNFNVIIPKPFILSEQPKSALDDIRSEVMEKVTTWERRMSTKFNDIYVISDSWRIKPRSATKKESKTLFDSKSGETHRGTETLATVWQRMLTASDPYFEAVAMGLNSQGQAISETELYATEGVLTEQQRASKFKKKLLKFLRSLSLYGTSIAEEPLVSLPYGFGRKYMQYTDFIPRSLLLTGFDTAVADIYDSDFIFTIDFVSKWMLRNLASQNTEYWDMALVEKHIQDFGEGMPSATGQSYSRLQQSRTRAGYYDNDAGIYENLNYHGRLDPNPVIEAYMESVGADQDPKFVDWTVGILDGMDVAKFHMTQYGDWRTRFKAATYKEFENEPLGYGVGQLGRKLQRGMDILESLTDDKLMFDVLNMMKIGKYSGYDAKQFVAEPLKMVELEDINQLAPLVGDPRVLQQALAMIAMRREDFRNIVGAQTNLQAQANAANSATEAAISQTEAIRSAGVHAEIIGEVIREHLDTSHINNLNHMDEGIWIGLTGERKPMYVDKSMLPISVGFIIKIVTDKDFRPERQKNLLQFAQILTSIRQFFPTSINALKPTIEEIYRNFGMNPRLLSQPMSIQDVMERRINEVKNSGALSNQNAGEIADEQSGNVNLTQTPVGPVPTSSVQMPDTSA